VTWYTDDCVTTIRDDVMVMSLSVLCMSGVTNNALFNGIHSNDNNTTPSSSSLSAAAAVTVVYPTVLHTYSI